MTTNPLPQAIVPAPQPVSTPQVLYTFSSLFIGRELWVRNQLVRVRSIYAPTGKPRWQHVAEAIDLNSGEELTLLTGQAVSFTNQHLTAGARYWMKYQGGEVWVVYALRHDQLIRYQGGTFRQLDSRPTRKTLQVPRGSVEVAGHYAPTMGALLAMSNHRDYLAGKPMDAEFHEKHESLAREINEIAAKSFWHYKQATPGSEDEVEGGE